MHSYWKQQANPRFSCYYNAANRASKGDIIEIDARVVKPGAARRGFDIVPANEVSADALSQFYERAYPARAEFLARHWRWLYRYGKNDLARGPLLALEGENVIGHIGAIPMSLRAGTDTREAVWDVDLAVLPEHQGRKVATRLMQAQRERYPLHVAFGNEKSTGTVTKIGWQLNQATRSFQLLLRPEMHPKFQHGALQGVGRMSGWLTRLLWAARARNVVDLTATPVSAAALKPFSQTPADEALHVTRTPEFLKWRVLDHPATQEHFILRGTVGANAEYAALVRLSEQGGFRRLHLLSLLAEPLEPAALARFFASVVRWSLDRQIHRVLMVTSRPAIAQVAQRWFPLTSALRFLTHAQDKAGWRYLSAPLQHWECLDSDFDLSA